MSDDDAKPHQLPSGRFRVVLGGLVVALCALLWRAVDLHVVDREFLQQQGDARYLRVVSIPAHRGMITDRHGEPLAISTPVDSVWANPQELAEARSRWPELAKTLELGKTQLAETVDRRLDREFVYLRRRVEPELGERTMALGIPGVSLQREYRRYYPTGEVTAHVIGFTDVDDRGQEGIELLFNDDLSGIAGSKRVIKDRLGRIIENVEGISDPRPGQTVALSIDRRLQYLAYRELKAAVQRHQATGGSAVMLDVRTGEVLAMVNQPAYNPNNRRDLSSRRYRNRAVTDVFEPGSTIKPFTVAAALESGRFKPDTPIDTNPGTLRLAGFTIRDFRNYGLIDVTTVIQKSSNVGASRIALTLEPRTLWDTFTKVGFGVPTGSGFPGEVPGQLRPFQQWREVDRAALSYGYGLSATALQLTHAYSAIAGDGVLRPVRFTRYQGDALPEGEAVMARRTAEAVRTMLEGVVQSGGTGTAAKVPGYRVAGKTGTVRKADSGGYSEDRYLALFAGMAPASRPRLALVVVVDEPKAGQYYGGEVAAPVFARVMEGALRLLDVPPDDVPSLGFRIAMSNVGEAPL